MAVRKLSSTFIVALFLGTALAGCLGAGEEGPDEDDVDAQGRNGNDQDFSRMPANRTGEMTAYRETNQTEEGVGGDPHTHDYWQGRMRVSLFETTAEMPPAPTTDGAEVVFRPPPPHLVYEGTAHVEITIHNPHRHFCYWGVELNGEWICSSNPDHWGGGVVPGDQFLPELRDLPPMEVSFIHGASDLDAWIPAGTIEWDTPFVIEVQEPIWTDMPHARASLWAFKFETSEPLDNTLVFDVAMDIVRDPSDEIPLWPGHPEFYGDSTHRHVHEGSGLTRDEGAVGGRHFAGTIAEPHFEPVNPSRLISYGTHTLHVYVNITRMDSPGGDPDAWFLMYQNATRSGERYTNPLSAEHPGDARELYWVIEVDPDGMDTPYGTESRWEFTLRGAYYVGLTCLGNCIPYEVEYDMSIIASNEILDEEAYHATDEW